MRLEAAEPLMRGGCLAGSSVRLEPEGSGRQVCLAGCTVRHRRAKGDTLKWSNSAYLAVGPVRYGR